MKKAVLTMSVLYTFFHNNILLQGLENRINFQRIFNIKVLYVEEGTYYKQAYLTYT